MIACEWSQWLFWSRSVCAHQNKVMYVLGFSSLFVFPFAFITFLFPFSECCIFIRPWYGVLPLQCFSVVSTNYKSQYLNQLCAWKPALRTTPSARCKRMFILKTCITLIAMVINDAPKPWLIGFSVSTVKAQLGYELPELPRCTATCFLSG